MKMNFFSICLVLCLLLHASVGIHSESAVRYLPGFDGALPFQLRTGYVSIDDESGGVEMFYYFFKSESNPSKDPLIFWFTGGPGCSGLSCITFDIGPLSFNIAEYNGTLPTLKLNPYSWTKSAKKNCGEEYVNVDSNNVQCRKDLRVVSKCIEGIYANYILEPKCLVVASKLNKIVKYRSSLEQQSMNTIRSPPGVPGFECRSYGYMLSYYWANDKEVQAALNVRKGKTREWVRCNWNELHYVFNVQNTTGYHVNLSRNGYRSLIYSGDHDMIVPFMSTQKWIKSLNYAIIDDWRPWFVKGQIGGYTRTYANNMTFTTIKGGGHTAAEYKPRECFNMVKRWLAYEPL